MIELIEERIHELQSLINHYSITGHKAKCSFLVKMLYVNESILRKIKPKSKTH